MLNSEQSLVFEKYKNGEKTKKYNEKNLTSIFNEDETDLVFSDIED